MDRALKRSVLGVNAIILSKNIHKVTQKDYVWFGFLSLRHYLNFKYIDCLDPLS